MKLQAREILRAAKRHGIKLTPRIHTCCAISVITKEVSNKALFLPYDVADKLGIDPGILFAIEAGFENYNVPNNLTIDFRFSKINKQTYDRYRRVGERVRRAINEHD